MNRINYLFLRFFAFLIGILPWFVFYKLSDLVAWILRVIVGYRKDIVLNNLKKSFPNHSREEINSVCKKFYTNLSDVLLEGIRGFTISTKEVNERYVWKNPEVTDQFFQQGKHVIGMASHYGNWEWGTQTIGHQLQHRVLGIVKLVKNPLINEYLQKTRCAQNVYVADISETTSAIEKYSNEPTLFIFITDQGPRNIEKAQWVDFLNQKTPCLYGADRLARKNNWPVVNIKVERIKRGFYELDLELIASEPINTVDGEITAVYMKSLEQQIISKPEDWLWSHRRWKRADMLKETP